MADAARARKLATRIREIVADQLRTQVKDPRLGMVTITDVKITADLRDSTVFYTVLGNGVEKAATAVALESAKGVLRAAIGRGTGVKFTPTLAFQPDDIPETARDLEDLLAKARAADEELQRKAAEAEYAGEPDPYKAPREDDDALDEAEPGPEPASGPVPPRAQR
ncbi:MAG: ribosome-binding factor [Cryptosporangiaceae bacterium]|jgi:ribosome-binding factor A|nr:ribosome-binding factor [Cryptosporangiaceae bacterium]